MNLTGFGDLGTASNGDLWGFVTSPLDGVPPLNGLPTQAEFAPPAQRPASNESMETYKIQLELARETLRVRNVELQIAAENRRQREVELELLKWKAGHGGGEAAAGS